MPVLHLACGRLAAGRPSNGILRLPPETQPPRRPAHKLMEVVLAVVKATQRRGPSPCGSKVLVLVVAAAVSDAVVILTINIAIATSSENHLTIVQPCYKKQ